MPVLVQPEDGTPNNPHTNPADLPPLPSPTRI
jgi:hypothetical protein